MDHNQLRDYIRGFRLGGCARGDQGYNRVLLQLFGYSGHGKSSFINSCKYVLDGEYKGIAETGDREGGLTMIRRSYKLTDTITIVDNRGYRYANAFEVLETSAQLGNFLPLDEKVDWPEDHDSFMMKLQKSELNLNTTDFIVPILVYSASNPLCLHENNEMKGIIRLSRDMTGVFPIVVLTKKTSGHYFDSQKAFRSFGAEDVFAVDNYTEDDNIPTRGRHTDILNVLKCAVDDVKFKMENERRNPRAEHIQRKTFLLTLAHMAENEDKREKQSMEQIIEEMEKKNTECLIL